ncbi:hypothetical protein [Donghicola mangrovi]|uniref:Uncharacterized protein n=1 Tax=Donghicola mangrovi TaxID=2729614 RepID=A0A850QH96_9RHOB|nr:hypothetical protein [Donghicola mangrovi]NVO25735.1 hypothetical protein [Donghicola mangrovi]
MAKLVAGEDIVSGVFMAFDPEAPTKAEVQSKPGKLISAKFKVDGTARWLGLHIKLGNMDLSKSMIFGIACRSQAPRSTTFRPCLRSGGPNGFKDTFFKKVAIAYSEESLHLDALQIDQNADLMAPADWRELILFIRPETGSLELNDLRLFTV